MVTAGPLSSRDRHVAAVRSAVREHLTALADPTRGYSAYLTSGIVTVAVSGGRDSLALTALTVPLAHHAGYRVRCVTVDHGLQADSRAVAERAAATARELGADEAVVLPVTVHGPGGMEAAARAARYAALREAAEHTPVLLGHTRDDQAETVLLGLGRGSGPRSIAGMRPFDLPWVRPLLDVPRAATTGACAALALRPWQDPHNTDPSLTRARLRAEVLPLLEDVLQGGVAAALARTARQIREDADALDELAAARPVDAPAEVAELADLPGPVRRRWLRRWLLAAGVRELSDAQLRAVDELITAWRGQGPVWLPGGIAVARAAGMLTAGEHG